MAERISNAANKAVEIGLWGFIGIVHGACRVYDSLPSSETVSNTVQSLGSKIRQAQTSPTSVTRTDGDWELIDEFKAPDVIPESGNGIELLEAGLFYPSKQHVPIYDIETGFGGSSTKPIPFDVDKWKCSCGPTFEDSLDEQ
jgi:hypothetical protein